MWKRSEGPGDRPGPRPAPRLKVWDAPLRLLHWSLAGAVLVAWLSTDRFSAAHEPAGWLALAAAGLRLIWGAAGPRYARFAQFVRSPRATWRYAIAALRAEEARYIGHNPLGGCMVLALLATVLATTLSGALMLSDLYWGDPQLGRLHEACAWALMGLVVLHVAGVVFTSWRHRENLVRAMFDGCKRAPEETDVS